jgi:hypothetical protein
MGVEWLNRLNKLNGLHQVLRGATRIEKSMTLRAAIAGLLLTLPFNSFNLCNPCNPCNLFNPFDHHHTSSRNNARLRVKYRTPELKVSTTATHLDTSVKSGTHHSNARLVHAPHSG